MDDQLMPMPQKKLISDELVEDIPMKDKEGSMSNRADLVEKDLKSLQKYAKKLKIAIQKPVTHKNAS